MKRVLMFAAVGLVLAACGTETNGNSTTPTGPTSTTSQAPTATVSSTLPSTTQGELLDAARQTWASSRPNRYYLRYGMECECIHGPFEVYVDENGTFSALNVTDRESDYVPYRSVDDVFNDIAAAIESGAVPIEVDYHPDFGLPMVYSYNPPGQAYDAGFVMRVGIFEPDEAANAGEKIEARRRLEEAQSRWTAAGIDRYTFTLSRLCFCPEEWLGPYEVTVVRGKVTSVLFAGEDIRDRIDVDSLDDFVETPDSLFPLIRQALGSSEAGNIAASYHPDLGYPISASIDWIEFAVDDEISYQISDLQRLRDTYPDTCSADALTIDLIDQPSLPERVAATRQAIYDAAINCDFAALRALTDSSPYFTATFGGTDDPAGYWADLELRGERVIEAMILHLNLPYTNEEETFLWPNAFVNLEAPDGTGITPEEYDALLQIYSRVELQEMFDGIGGYVGYRHGILASGDWIFFLAGD